MSRQSTAPQKVSSTAKRAASKILRKAKCTTIDIAIILGSGWSVPEKSIGRELCKIRSEEVPGFYSTPVEGHSGTIRVVRLLSGKSALIIGARTHLYQNKGPKAVAHPVRVAAVCGAQTIILTNGAGSIRREWSPGSTVLIADQINLTAQTPLDGSAFVDLTDLYSRRLRDIAKRINPNLEEGVYVQFRGPQYETPAEVQMARIMGGHIVGMSTALEAVAARELHMEVLGLSLITNLAAGISSSKLDHQEVLETGLKSADETSSLLARILEVL